MFCTLSVTHVLNLHQVAKNVTQHGIQPMFTGGFESHGKASFNDMASAAEGFSRI
jgi:hypothetical protein